MDIPKNRVVFIGVIAAAVLILGIVIIFNRQPSATINSVSLTVWGTESREQFQPILSGYAVLRPNVTVNYLQVSPENYNKKLFDAFTTGEAPDVFMLGNHDVWRFSKVLASPTSSQMSVSALDQYFPRAVRDDMVLDGRILALPIYMDTLALVYNRDLLDQAGMAMPPSTWQEVLDSIAKLRKQNAQGQITASAIALGSSDKSIPNSADIISWLMLQNGTVMSGSDGRPSFASGRGSGPAALRYYLDFANPSAPTYTWSDGLGNAFDSFIAGKTAMVLAYYKDIQSFKAKSPFLHFNVSAAPQINPDQTVNYPSYQSLAVWKRSRAAGWGWDFVTFAATDPAANKAYLLNAHHPPALRALIPVLSSDPELGVFAKQSLTARSWLIPDYDKMKEIFSGAVASVFRGELTPDRALQAAQEEMAQTIP